MAKTNVLNLCSLGEKLLCYLLKLNTGVFPQIFKLNAI